MSPDELQGVLAAFIAWQKQLGQEGSAVRDAVLELERGWRRAVAAGGAQLAAYRARIASQFPPGTDLSQVRLGWVIPRSGRPTAAPPDPGEKPTDEAMPADDTVGGATPQPNPTPGVLTEAEVAAKAEAAFVQQLSTERKSHPAGYCASRDVHFAWGANQTPRVPQGTIKILRKKYLTDDEKVPGVRPRKPSRTE
jgi:hypothetical protein